ncbi:leucine-rich repeat, immunoglobulin-like domain and transmembrane domain-containing protein 3 isoform X2 [Lacerta agilis]|uniref:leucine-rich repeat, immunoglobulin-like domain and transmembrane domain-containing protein 3 isoform X2 n=2 Tax=Lacerta agilis TaxID=80427 RepID=UPI0014192660|nr:leucine-rich repeat, immunoglobulin-like domain and transmembrane domain-containing protein 3 isoform X2 [Lacerta agilis]
MDAYVHSRDTQRECPGIKDFRFWVYQLSWKEVMYLIAAVCIVMSFLEEVDSFCPSQCNCIYHGRGDDTGTRSVLCNDPDMFEVPVNVPVDTVKLRIEKTVIRKIPTEAFYYLVDLKYLWLTYNSIANIDTSSFYNLKLLHELRLDGNLLSSFPWESLAEMPNLRTLDLHNNLMTSIPAEAGKYLRNLTYLDISSNKLTSLPSDILDILLPFSETGLPRNTEPRNADSIIQRVILGLQDNPWYCDCRISKLIEFSKIVDTTILLLDPFVACSGPESLAGILFQRAELEQCLKPSVMTSATKITSPLGSNVLLRCDATGYPTPQLTWVRSDNVPVNYTVIQESPGEGVRWSIISLTGISYKDAGDYRCKAKNLAGMSEAAVTVTVVGVVTTTVSPQKYGKKTGADQQNTTQEEVKQESLNATTASPSTLPTSTSSPTTVATSVRPTTDRSSDKKPPKSMPDGRKNSKSNTNGGKKQPGDVSKKDDGTSLSAAAGAEKNGAVKNLRVIPETDERVTLTWKTANVTSNSSLTVLYSKYGEKDMLPLSTDPLKNKVTIDGLEPSTQYMACVVPKGTPPTKDQCIIFSTDGITVEDDYQIPILLVAGGVACAVVLPLIFFLLYKVLMLHRKPKPVREDDLEKETYVKFETLSLKPRCVVAGGELWARRNTDESERLLLCSRSSMDSQMTFKSEGSRSEYLC